MVSINGNGLPLKVYGFPLRGNGFPSQVFYKWLVSVQVRNFFRPILLYIYFYKLFHLSSCGRVTSCVLTNIPILFMGLIILMPERTFLSVYSFIDP
jgi:hypothetical protein